MWLKKKIEIPSRPFGQQLSHFFVPGPLLACFSSIFRR